MSYNIQKDVESYLKSPVEWIWLLCGTYILCLYPQIYQGEMHTGKKACAGFPAEQIHVIHGNKNIWP